MSLPSKNPIQRLADIPDNIAFSAHVRLVLLFLMVAAFDTSAGAQQDNIDICGSLFNPQRCPPSFVTSVQTAGAELRICYGKVAALFGTEKCDPVDSMIDAVFGACAAQEERLKALFAGPLTPGMDGTGVVREIRTRFGSRIASIILMAQINGGRCRGTLPNQ